MEQPANGSGSRLELLRARIAVAEQARDAATSALSKDDRAEIALRQAAATAEAERRAAEQAKRDLDLERREDAARDAYGPDAKLCALSIDGYADTFVLRYDAKAFSKWKADVAAAQANKKLDRVDIERKYALASVVDWNGVTDLGVTSLVATQLVDFLRTHEGIAAAITNEAAKLAGLFSEARKSGGQ